MERVGGGGGGERKAYNSENSHIRGCSPVSWRAICGVLIFFSEHMIFKLAGEYFEGSLFDIQFGDLFSQCTAGGIFYSPVMCACAKLWFVMYCNYLFFF